MKKVVLICLVVGICCRSLGQQFQDAGIAKVVESQRWGVSISVPAGTSASEALKAFAVEHGMGEKLSADMAWTVGTVGFTQKEDKKGFFARRETAYGRAVDQAFVELTKAFPVQTFDDGAGEKATVSASFVILQAEGMNPTSGAYEVAVLAVRSKDLDKLLLAVCTGAGVVAAGPAGEPISDWAARTGGNLCGSRLVFDEKGLPWFVGGTSRGLLNPQSKNAASLRSRLLAESFARKLALQPVVGKTFEDLRVVGLRNLSKGAERDVFTGGFRYYEVCGVPADGLAVACRQAYDQIVRRRRELEAAARSVATLDDSERPAVVEQTVPTAQTSAHRSSAVENLAKKSIGQRLKSRLKRQLYGRMRSLLKFRPSLCWRWNPKKSPVHQLKRRFAICARGRNGASVGMLPMRASSRLGSRSFPALLQSHVRMRRSSKVVRTLFAEPSPRPC